MLSTESETKDAVQLLLVFHPSLVSYLMLFLGHDLAFQFSLQGPDNAASNEDSVATSFLRVSFSTVSFSFTHTKGTLDGHFSSYFQSLITSAMDHLDHQATCSMKLVHSVGINFLMDHLKSH